MKYTAIRSEGGLLPYDLLDEILAETAPGQKPADFGLPKGRRVSDEIQRVWSDAQELWSRFKAGRDKLPEKDPHGTTLTRDRWIGPLLTDPVRFSYELHYQPSAVVLDGLTFPISYRAGEPSDSPPVHIEGSEIELDKRPPKYRTSPQAMVQEFLNRSEPHLWGVVTNGLRFRLLRDSVRTARPTYLEFDLETILEGAQYNEFALLYRLCHRTRLPQAGHPPEDCLLEKYYLESLEKGGRVRDNLRDGVEEALKVLGTGFLRHPDNSALRQRVTSAALSADQYHRQLLLLVYRLLFLTVAEDRRLIISIGENADRNQTIYRENYSMGKLRDRAEGILEDSGFSDLWIGLVQAFKLFSDSNDTNPLGIPPLNGDLFSHTTIPDLDTAQLSNLDLLKAMRCLMFYREKNVQHRVNYAALNVEELGSVYESLLDFRPMVAKEPEGLKFDLGLGSERKTTGSYYTRPELVRELIQSALVPVMEDRLAEAEEHTKAQSANAIRTAKAMAILNISVCDPACGSGHFILEAARRLGKELAQIRVGEDEPTPEQFHMAVRDVISHCIHGVDLNPLAVDLCKLALWLEGHWIGKPLSFLDHRIRCGNSLIGLLDPTVMAEGISDEVFNPVTGDDKKVAAAYKKRNRAERASGQKRLEFEQVPAEHSHEYAELFGIRLDFAEEKPSDVKRKAELFEKARGGADWWHDWTAANLWTASFFVSFNKLDDPLVPTHEIFNSYFLHRKDRPQMTGFANSLAGELHFFHWHLEFPDVFEKGGFDVVLGNPPWERIKLQEEEHWADDPYVGKAPTKAERSKRIEAYRQSDDPKKVDRIRKFDLAKHVAEATSKFIRGSTRFPLTAVGDINTYALFAELARNLIRDSSRVGVVVPTGIATDDTCKTFFSAVMDGENLVSLFDFENRGYLFPTLHTKTKFCLLTLSTEHISAARFSFMCTEVQELRNPLQSFALNSGDLRLINPNSRTCPIFRTSVDAELTKKIYKSVKILINEAENHNPWKIKYQNLIHMANDSELFRAAPSDDLLRLYEAKMFWHFDHRWATFDGVSVRECALAEKQNPEFLVTPRYWVSEKEVQTRLDLAWKHRWFICVRGVTDSRNERSVVASIVPYSAVGHSAFLMLIGPELVKKVCLLLACLNSLCLDYIARQKIAGMNLSFYMVNQFPVFPPSKYNSIDEDFITQRILELVYTASDLSSFAADLNCHQKPFGWNEERRAYLRSQVDAYFAHLYGLTRSEVAYILAPSDVFDQFPGETFRVLRENEMNLLGEYRTQGLVLKAFDELSESDRFHGEKRECTITGKPWTVGD